MKKTSSEQRHFTMASIRGENTKPELVVRRGLWIRGFRYRLNYNRLPGHPDIVLRKYRTCIFVNGCFWHGHYVDISKMNSSKCCRLPDTNYDFWATKIRKNMERDVRILQRLAEMGWHCITVWECELTPKLRERTIEAIAFTLNHIWIQDHSLHNK